MKNKLRYIHPFLFAIAPAVFLWRYNFAEVQVLREVVPIAAILAAFAGLVLAICQILYCDVRKAAIMASVFLVLTLFYYHIFFDTFLPDFLMRHRYALLISFVAIAGLGYFLYKTRRNLITANTIGTVVSGMFILLSVVQLSPNFYQGYGYATPSQHQIAGLEIDGKETRENLRDIYYIIFDDYVAPDVVEKVMGYEEEKKITSWLEERGFFVPEASRSNYSETAFSLPSSLNMRYLDESEQKSASLRLRVMQDNLIKDFLRARGYRYMHILTIIHG